MAVFFQRRDRTNPCLRGRSRLRLEALEERTLLSAYSDAVLADGPSGYWRLGEFKGDTAADSSGFERHGTYVGGVTLGQTGAIAGDKDTAVGFDGKTTLVEVAGKPFNLLVNYTLEAWVVNPGQIDPNPVGRIIANGQPGSRGYGWGVRAGPGVENTIRFTTYGVRDYDTDVIIPVDEAYHHVVATLTEADELFTARIYLDGELRATLSHGVVPRLSDLNFTIGRNPQGATPPEYWNGIIDEVAVYEYVLTDEQILFHYLVGIGAGGSPGGGPGHGLTAGIAPDAVRVLSADRVVLAPMPLAGGLTWSPTADQEVAAVEQLFAALPAEDPQFLPPPAQRAGPPSEGLHTSLTEELLLVI